MSGAFTAVVITPPENGVTTVRKVEVPASDQGSLEFFQSQVGGYIEHLFSEDRKTDFWLNEEGKLQGLPINIVATEVLYDLHPVFRGQDVLAGTVIITGNRGPNTASVPAATWDRIKSMQFTATESAGIAVEIVDDDGRVDDVEQMRRRMNDNPFDDPKESTDA